MKLDKDNDKGRIINNGDGMAKHPGPLTPTKSLTAEAELVSRF